MTGSDDTTELARRFLDLWQQQVAAMASDPTLVELALRFMAPFAASPGPGGGPSNGHDGAANGAARAAAPAAAPGDVVARLDELAGRLALCEERLAALDAKPGRRRRGARPGPRARRS
jgi:hypothetical protein